MTTSKEMTTGRALPLLVNFTLPLLLGNILQQTYSLVDAAIVGKYLGIHSLAAVGASSSVIFLILGFCNGCSCGFGIPVAQKFGARDYSLMRRYIFVSLKLSLVLSVAVAIVTSLYCADILRIMQTPENIFDGAYAYLLVTFIGVPCTFLYNLLSSIIRALGDSKTPFWFLLFATVLNVLLDLVCILILDWGVFGAGIATVISQGVSALLCYFYMFRHFQILKPVGEERRFQGALARKLLKIGLPMGLQFSITAIGSIMLQSANNALGTACVAAFTSAVRIKMFFLCPLESLGIAMATYSGQNYGAGKPRRILEGIKASVFIMLLYTALTYLTEQFAPAGLIICRPCRNGNPEKYGIILTRGRLLLPGLGTALHSPLHHPGSGIYKLSHAFRRIGDDCPGIGQCVCRTCIRLSRRLFRRPDGMGGCRFVSYSGIYFRLPENPEITIIPAIVFPEQHY